MKKLLFVLLIATLLFSGLSCLGRNEVKVYAKSLNLPPEVVETITPLGKDGMDENEKALIDEIYFWPQEVQVSETALNFLNEIVQDTIVSSEELDRFEDLDQDGLNNYEELSYGTDLLNPDTDDDGLGDREEILTHRTDPLNPDSDQDGLKDGEEILTHKTDPLRSDSDYDDLNDGDEVLIHGTNPLKEDTDADGLIDEEEITVYKSDPLDRDDPFLNKDSDGDGVIDCDDLEPLKENSYKETVSWLSLKMKWDALSCIDKMDKLQTFGNLHAKVYENVPHAKFSRGKNAYPNAKWDAYSDWRAGPRDILMNYYSYHKKVQMPPDCDDIACVYDIMADYIIEQTGWDEEGEQEGNNGVDCDPFPCTLNGENHYVCVVHINGAEYLVDPSFGHSPTMLGQASRYKFPWEEKWDGKRSWTNPAGAMKCTLFSKFDKRFSDSIYNRYMRPVSCSWTIYRNQTPENEKKLEALYLKIAYQGD